MARFQLSGQARRAVAHAIEVADQAAAAAPQVARYIPSSRPA
jgi:nucleoid-associated protein YgaU